MKRFWVTAALSAAMAVSPANAADWWFVSSSDGHVGVVDMDSVTRSGEIATIDSGQALAQLLEGQHAAIVGRVENDCDRRTYRAVQMSTYGADGTMLVTPFDVENGWEPAGPGSVAEAVLDAACLQSAGQPLLDYMFDVEDDIGMIARLTRTHGPDAAVEMIRPQ